MLVFIPIHWCGVHVLLHMKMDFLSSLDAKWRMLNWGLLPSKAKTWLCSRGFSRELHIKLTWLKDSKSVAFTFFLSQVHFCVFIAVWPYIQVSDAGESPFFSWTLQTCLWRVISGFPNGMWEIKVSSISYQHHTDVNTYACLKVTNLLLHLRSVSAHHSSFTP